MAFLLREDFSLAWSDWVFLLQVTPCAVIAAHLAFVWVGTYRALWRYATVRDLGRLVAGATLAVILLMAGLFLWERLASVPRSVPVIQWLVLTAILLGGRLAYSLAIGAGRGRLAGDPGRRWEPVLLIGGGDSAALVMHLLANTAGPENWRPVGILDDRMTIGRMIGQVPILGRFAEFRQVLGRLTLQGMRPRRIIVTAPHDELGMEALRAIQKKADAEGIPIDNLPELLRFRGEWGEAPVGQVVQAQALLAAIEKRSYFATKRVLDVVCSLAVLIFLAPFLGVVALALWLSIGSPILFRQVRAGRGRVPFVLYKFRTMREAFGPDERPLRDDLRTPWIGRLLRRFRLDELPQFWNVLIGDMSIIGPRPLLESDLAQLADDRNRRSSVPPGITGWAQVHGGHQLGPEAKLALDLWYVRHASLGLDLRTTALTLRMMAFGERVDELEVERAKSALVAA